MFRVPGNIKTFKFLLHRSNLVYRFPPPSFRLPPSAQITTTNVIRVQYKHPAERPRLTCCPRPQPPPEPPKPDLWKWAILTALLSLIAFTTYARNNLQLRDMFTIYLPWFDDFIAFLFRENYGYIDFFKRKYAEYQKKYEEYMNIPEECCGPPKEEALPCDPCAMRMEYERRKICAEVEETPKPCDLPPPPPPPKPKDVCELEKCVKELEKLALETLDPAIKTTKKYNEEVPKQMKAFTPESFPELRKQMEDKDKTIDFATTTTDDVKRQLSGLKELLNCGAVQGDPEKMEAMNNKLDEVLDQIECAEGELKWENIHARTHDKYWQKVEGGVKKYVNDVNSFYPSSDLSKPPPPPPNIDGEDLDFALIHSMKYNNHFKQKVLAAEESFGDKVDRGLATLDQDPKKKKERDDKIEKAEKKGLDEQKKEGAKREKELKAQLDKNHKDKMAEQKKRLKEESDEMMKKKEKEINENFDKAVKKNVDEERHKMKMDREELQAKIDIVEDKLAAKKKEEEDAKKSQELYNVGSSMLKALKSNDDIVRVDNELAALKKNAENDELVETVYKSIPSSVGERGLVPESKLKYQYHRMEDVALKVALVEETGGPYPVYVLSWIQSKLLGWKINSIPAKELKNPPKKPEDLEELDTFDLMQRARYHVNDGNIAGAIPYVNNLEGASRVAADPWYKWALDYVSTKQAAEAIVAHAANLGKNK